MAYTTVDQHAPLRLVLPVNEAAELALAEAQSVLDRHSHFTTDPRDKHYCADCVETNLCQAMTGASAVFAEYGRTPRRTRPSRVIRALREAKRREDAWLAE